MHELGICEGVLSAVEQRARGRLVAAVGVRVGAHLGLDPAVFRTSFALAASGGLAEGAVAQVTLAPSRASCRDCGEVFETDDPLPDCPACGGMVVHRDGGDELVVEWIEYRDAPKER
jgi:hydrogenase nickel incorporation protein HypA/HybF